MRNLLLTTIVAAALYAPAIASASDDATTLDPGAEACGGIDLWDIGECHFEFDGGCQASCEPVSFVAACEGRCELDVETSCTNTCGAACEASCNADPGRFDCRASCFSDCTAEAEATCGTDQECRSYLEANCSASCEGQCDLVAPSASCEAQCGACCSGSCDVEANFDCGLSCAAELRGGCEIACEQPEGALFCDGQYLPVQDLPACVAYLAENFEVRLDVQAEASAAADLSCSAGPVGGQGHSWMGWALFGLAFTGFGVARRRR